MSVMMTATFVLSGLSIVVSGMTVHWSRQSAQAVADIDRIRAERTSR